MIKITLQRNDSKAVSDKVSYTQDTITINEQEFTFPAGVDLLFESPHEQIIDPKRDSEGILHATIIKQYTGADRLVFETCDEHGHYCQCQADNITISRMKTTPVVAEIKVEEVTVADLIRNKETEVKDLKEQYLDADIDDNDKLQLDLKKQIQEIKKELILLNENVDKG